MLSEFTYHLLDYGRSSVLEIYMGCHGFHPDGVTKLLSDRYNIYSKRIMNHTIKYVIIPFSKDGMIKVIIE